MDPRFGLPRPQHGVQQDRRVDHGLVQQQHRHQQHYQPFPQPYYPPYPHFDHYGGQLEMDKAHHRPQQQPSNQQHPLQVQPQAQQVYYDHQYQHDDHQYQHDGQQQRLHDRIYQEYLYQQHLQRQQQLENLLKGPASFISYGRLYELFQCVGPSSEGSVSLARTFVRTSPTTELRVVKMVKSGGPDVSGPPREALMLNTAGPHPNVIKMFEVAYDQRWGKALLCIEYCSGGNLYEMQQDYCNREVPVPKQVVFQAIINISDALAFIHGGWVRDNATGNYRKTIDLLEQRRIVHRDLKPENVFVRLRSEDGKLPTFVLGDFGQAFLHSEAHLRAGGGTRGFQAPELLDKLRPVPITDKADVYSFGVTAASLCQGLPSPTGLGTRADLFECGGHPSTLRLPYYLGIYSIEALLRSCLAPQPRDRPEMSPSGVLAWTEGYRTLLESMKGHVVELPQKLRAANVEVARPA